METKTFTWNCFVRCDPETLFNAWLDSNQHSKMIGNKAEVSSEIGGVFSIWDGQITGHNVEINSQSRRIVQKWKLSIKEWPETHFSILTLEFHPKDTNGTMLNLTHEEIPADLEDIVRQSWMRSYLRPMISYCYDGSK